MQRVGIGAEWQRDSLEGPPWSRIPRGCAPLKSNICSATRSDPWCLFRRSASRRHPTLIPPSCLTGSNLYRRKFAYWNAHAPSSDSDSAKLACVGEFAVTGRCSAACGLEPAHFVNYVTVPPRFSRITAFPLWTSLALFAFQRRT